MIKKIFITHHTHMDIGYTDLPLEVMDQHLNHLDEALDLCRKHDDFYWTIESAYLVKDYLRNRPEKCQSELIQALKDGKIELQAFETQPLTELLSADELFRCVEYACELGDKYGFAVKSAMIDDIGGYAGRLPTVLAHCGVEYLTAGVGGFQVHLPCADLPHLFYLTAKDGARTLVWNLGIDRSLVPQDMTGLYAVYGQAALFLFLPAIKEYLDLHERGVEIDFASNDNNAPDTESVFTGFLKRLEKENYPWEEVMLQYGGDNRGPAAFLPQLINKLNASGKFPAIELTTPSRFFDYMKKKYNGRIPEIKGVITDPWNSRANPTPEPLKNYRAAQRIYYSDLARLTLNKSVRNEYIDELCRAVDENLQLYGDHTCGLSEWTWPEEFTADGCRGQAYDRYRESWKAKAFYAAAAKDGAVRIDRLIKNYLGAGLADGKPAVVVWNDSAQPVSGTTEIYFGRDAFQLQKLSDSDGFRIPFQEIGHNRYLIAVENVPPFTAKTLYPVFSERPGCFVCQASQAPDCFENAFFKVKFAQNGNLMSVKDKRNGAELLDQSSKWSLGEFIMQRIDDLPQNSKFAGMKVNKESYFPKPEIIENTMTANGSVITAVTQNGQMETDAGLVRFQRTLLFYHNYPRIDVKIRLDKPESEKKTCCYIAFPFAGKNGEFKFDQNIGLIDLSRDLLPGAMLDLFYCSRFTAVETDDSTMVIATPDAPLVQFGGIQTARWLQEFPFRPQTNHIYGQLYHNLLNTDCPVWQDILETFTYSIWFHSGKFDYPAAQADWNSSTALSTSFSNGKALTEAVPESLQVSPSSVRLLSLRKTGKTCRLILENTTSEVVTAEVRFKNKSLDISIAAYGLVSVDL